jgi:transcriptional regulator with XRE-family HTH domain
MAIHCGWILDKGECMESSNNEEKTARFTELRQELGLTQDKFGEKLGMSYAAVSLIELGKTTVNEKHIKLIAGVFGVNEEWLRDGKGSMLNDEAIPGAKDLMNTYKELIDVNRKLVLNHAHYLRDSQKIAEEKGERRANTTKNSV